MSAGESFALHWLVQGKELDGIAAKFLGTLSVVPAGEGVYGYSLVPNGDLKILVSAHRRTIQGSYRHLFKDNGNGARSLWGAIEFQEVDGDKPVGPVLHSIYFDRLGNGSIAGYPQLTERLTDDTPEGKAYLREQVRFALVNAVQAKLRVVV